MRLWGMVKRPSKSELSGGELLSRLKSPNRVEAWKQFLDAYSSLIVLIASRYERGGDQVNDCYLFICEKLCEHDFRRLQSYKPEGSASFRSWLNVVIANLCIDWRRHSLGRERPFASIANLPQLEQMTFKYKFQRRMNLQACLERIQMHFPGLTEPQLASAIARVSTTLTSSQHWLLSSQQTETISLHPSKTSGKGIDPVESQPGPEQTAEQAQHHEKLQCALDQLTPRQRLLIKLRYQQDLSLKEVARLMRIGDLFRARRQIQVALEELKRHMDAC